MTKQDILDAYKDTGRDAQGLMKLLDRHLGGSFTESLDGSLKVYQTADLVVMVSRDGVEFFKADK